MDMPFNMCLQVEVIGSMNKWRGSNYLFEMIKHRTVHLLDMWKRDFAEVVCSVLVLLIIIPSVASGAGKLIDRIVAIVNDDVILLSDLKSEKDRQESAGRTLSDAEILERMIDDMLLFDEARRFRITVPEGDMSHEQWKQAVIREFVDRRVRALVYISSREIEEYYQARKDRFSAGSPDKYRAEIESVLEKEKMHSRLRKHIETLRMRSYIRNQL